MATLIDANGIGKQVFPRNRSKGFTLEELRLLTSSVTVQMIEIGEGSMMWMDEDGKYHQPQLTRNARATALLHSAGGAPDDFVVGTVLITNPGEIK